jgi:uncharacterized protein YggE
MRFCMAFGLAGVVGLGEDPGFEAADPAFRAAHRRKAVLMLSAAGLALGVDDAALGSRATRGEPAMTDSTAPEHTLTVVGHGKAVAEPNLARLTFAVGGEVRGTLAEARADTAERMGRCLTALAAFGISGPDLQSRHVSAGPQVEWHKGRSRTVGYVVTNAIQVSVRDLALVGEVIDALVTAGASNLVGPAFEVEEAAALRIAAHTAAVRDARATADAIAAALGVKIVGVARVGPEGGSAPPPFPQPRMLAAGAAFDAAPETSVEAGTIEVNATVAVAFLIAS